MAELTITEDKDKTGKTALMMAAQRGSMKMVNALLERRANINALNDDGQTALMMANYDNEVIQAIRKYSIENQVKITTKDVKILDRSDPGSYNRDFSAKK